MATSPQFPTTPVIGIAQISTANTARDGSGTMGTVLTGSANGTKVEAVVIKATVTTTAGTVRLFIHDGTNARLWREIPIVAITVSATIPAFETVVPAGITLPNNYSIRASTEKAETFNVFAHGGNL